MTLDEAKALLGDTVQSDGRLYDQGWYCRFTPGDRTAILDGDFDADDLEAIAIYMRAHAEKEA